MAKVFSMFGLLVAVVLLVIFGMDLALGDPTTGSGWPFMGFSKSMDIGFLIAAALLAYLSFSTFRELP